MATRTRLKLNWRKCEKCGKPLAHAYYARYENKVLCKLCNRSWTFAPDGTLAARIIKGTASHN